MTAILPLRPRARASLPVRALAVGESPADPPSRVWFLVPAADAYPQIPLSAPASVGAVPISGAG